MSGDPRDSRHHITDGVWLLPLSIAVRAIGLGNSWLNELRPAETLRVEVEVKERTSGEPLRIIFCNEIRPESYIDVPTQIRTALLRMLAHELDECLVDDDGRPIFEAHTAEGLSVPPVIGVLNTPRMREHEDNARASIVLDAVDSYLRRDPIAPRFLSDLGWVIRGRIEEAGL